MNKPNSKKPSRYHDAEPESEEAAAARHRAKRRPVRNWTKAYTEHEDEIEERDEFYER